MKKEITAFAKSENCRRSAICLMCVRKFRRNELDVLRDVPYEIFVEIGKYLYSSRDSDEWFFEN